MVVSKVSVFGFMGRQCVEVTSGMSPFHFHRKVIILFWHLITQDYVLADIILVSYTCSSIRSIISLCIILRSIAKLF